MSAHDTEQTATTPITDIDQALDDYAAATADPERLIAAARPHLSLRSLVRLTGHSPNTIRNLTPPPGTPRLTAQEAIERIHRYQSARHRRNTLIRAAYRNHGMTVRDIAERMNLGLATVHRVINP